MRNTMNNHDFPLVLNQKLHAARIQLGMETAIVSFIDNSTYTVATVDSEMTGVFKAGMVFPLENTYCRDVYDSNREVHYHHVGAIESMLQHPVYLSVKLESYIAAPINDEQGKVIGTVNFTSLMVQTNQFNQQQVNLVTNLAHFVSEHIKAFRHLVGELTLIET